MGLFGPPNIEKLKAKRDVQGLIGILSYQKDWHLRSAAAEALGNIGDARAVEPLVAALKGWYDGVIKSAAEALGKIGDARAVEPLGGVLKNGTSGGQKAAVEALGKIGDVRAIRPLIFALKSENEDVCSATIEALTQFGVLAAKPILSDINYIDLEKPNSVKISVLVKLGELAVEPLIHALQTGDKDIRRASALVLGKIGDARGVEPLVTTLQNKYDDLNIRKAAAEALGQIGDARVVEPLIAVLDDSEEIVRRISAEALISIYKRGEIDSAHKKLILDQRNRIMNMPFHSDHREDHSDKDCTGNPHVDSWAVHTDEVTHINF